MPCFNIYMTIQTRRINLDLPPNERWNDILQEYKYELLLAKKEMINLIDQFLGHSYYFIMPLIKTLRLAGSIKYVEEIKQLIKLSHPTIPKLKLNSSVIPEILFFQIHVS